MKKSSLTSLRERVKKPTAEALINSYYVPYLDASLKYLFDHEMHIHYAHGLMLAHQKITSSDDIRQILKCLMQLHEEGPKKLEIDYSQEDLYSYVERYLIWKLGPETGGRLHTARSRNDLHTTSWRMALREELLDLIFTLIGLRTTILRIASQHIETIMPGYTHSQHAQPITFGYYLLSVADLLRRDHFRLQAALTQADHCTLGSGALTTSGFPVDRHFTSELLGFSDIIEVAYDGVSCRDDLHEANAALAILMTNLSRISFDLQNWNTMEYGFIELGGEYASVSSIMPQKKNPQALEHAKAVAANVIGSLISTLCCSKNTSLSDVNDGVSAINQPALDAIHQTQLVLHVMNGVFKTLQLNPEKMYQSAQIGFGVATELADVIVRETGISFRMAHNLVGRVVRETIESDKFATDITPEDLDRAGKKLFNRSLKISKKKLKEALDPSLNVQVRTVVGGPNPGAVMKMIDNRNKLLKKDREAVTTMKKRISDALQRLLKEVEQFIA
jgi:argininosuccinate lyase